MDDDLTWEVSQEAADNPRWEEAGRVHDWRNHVGPHIKTLWGTLTPEQRRAIASDAAEDAMAEEWD